VPTGRDDRYSKVIENFEEGYDRWKLTSLRDAFSRFHGDNWETLRARFADKIEEKMESYVLHNSNRVVRTARVATKDVNEDARVALAKSQTHAGKVFRSKRDDKDDYYFLNGEQLVFYRSKTRTIDGQRTTVAAASNIWDDLLSNNLHKEGGVRFPDGKKPENLIKRILELSTEPGDVVLDSFAGSGTTGAVAQKMGRRWIMVELKEHCETIALPRLRSVIDGTDTSGVTKAVGWQGGGGFRYYTLAPSLLEKDKWGNWIISRQYNGAMLARALCKIEGFTYAPSDAIYWKQGHSTERDFIYVTTAHLNHEQLAQLSDEVGSERTLLVLCTAFRGKTDRYENLTVKKIPNQVLSRCEWGHDDYSLQVDNLPTAPAKIGQQEMVL
jgi:adenine-specific DNA-methyltransferase